jgi:hypothetical protein
MCCIDGQENKYSVLNECSRMLNYNISEYLSVIMKTVSSNLVFPFSQTARPDLRISISWCQLAGYLRRIVILFRKADAISEDAIALLMKPITCG